MQRGGCKTLLLTRLGGGAFGNPDEWIDDAILRCLAVEPRHGLDVRLTSYGTISPAMRRIEARWRAQARELGSSGPNRAQAASSGLKPKPERFEEKDSRL